MIKFYITHLYPKQMSLYGDMGNILALRYRLNKLGFEVIYQTVDKGQKLPAQTDFYFIGGGQDREQYEIFRDLLEQKEQLLSEIEAGVGLLAICGGYQLLGEKFLTGEGLEIDGLGLFPVATKAPDMLVKSRCIGNIIVQCTLPDLQGIELIGFENHSGQTYFTNQNKKVEPLGNVVLGFGNNAREKIEGCVYRNAIGTYLHGSCLPKNPELANYLIAKSVDSKVLREKLSGVTLKFNLIDDTIALNAKQSLIEKLLGLAV